MRCFLLMLICFVGCSSYEHEWKSPRPIPIEIQDSGLAVKQVDCTDCCGSGRYKGGMCPFCCGYGVFLKFSCGSSSAQKVDEFLAEYHRGRIVIWQGWAESAEKK